MAISLHVLEVLCFTEKYKGNLKQNFVIHEHNTRSKYNLYTQFSNTILFQKSVLSCTYLPFKIKILDNLNHFRKEVKNQLC